MTSAQEEVEEKVERVLFHVNECFVYMIPPRRSAASHRADEWNINQWAWEGAMKITVQGEESTIRLEDSVTGELYAQAPLRDDQPLPVEAVTDSTRFFVLRIEDSSVNPTKHAFIGVGFRERAEAYDFQVALYDHVKYLNKRKEAEDIEESQSPDCGFKQGESQRPEHATQAKRAPKLRVFDENFDLSFLKKALPAPPRSAKIAKLPSTTGETVAAAQPCTKSAFSAANHGPVPCAGTGTGNGNGNGNGKGKPAEAQTGGGTVGKQDDELGEFHGATSIQTI